VRRSYWLNAEIGKLGRIAVAVGGFLIMIGMILISTFILTLFNVLDIGVFTDETHMVLLTVALISVGVLDVVAGVMLWRR